MKGIFARHFFINALVILFSLLILGLMFLISASSYLSTKQHEQLSAQSDTITRFISSRWVTQGQFFISLDLRTYLSTYAEVAGVQVMIADTNGLVQLCSDAPGNCEHIGRYLPESTTYSLLGGSGYATQTTLGGLYPTLYSVVGSVASMPDGRPFCLILTASESQSGWALTVVFMRIFTFSSLLVLFLAGTSSYMVTRRLTEPMRTMAAAARKFALGDFSARAPVYAQRDELTELALSINEMAETVSRLEELRRGFIGNVSHELRTPMTIIAGFIDGILDGTIPADKHDEYLTLARDEVRRLSRLIAGMLSISRMESGQFEYRPRPVDVCEALRRVLLGFETRIEDKRLSVEAAIPDETLSVIFDPDALIQVLSNLIDNAVKYSNEAGNLWISAVKKNGMANVSVSNSGETVPEDEMARLFDQFHKSDKSRSSGGLGLGLYIVRAILNAHGVRISASSSNGVTCFSFSLRLVK